MPDSQTPLFLTPPLENERKDVPKAQKQRDITQNHTQQIPTELLRPQIYYHPISTKKETRRRRRRHRRQNKQEQTRNLSSQLWISTKKVVAAATSAILIDTYKGVTYKTTPDAIAVSRRSLARSVSLFLSLSFPSSSSSSSSRSSGAFLCSALGRTEGVYTSVAEVQTRAAIFVAFLHSHFQPTLFSATFLFT